MQLDRNFFKTGLVLFSICAINLISGTLYMFSAYSPQVASQLGYTAYQMSRIAVTVQSAAVLFGPVVGKLIDYIGFGPVAIFASLSITGPYFLFHKQYVDRDSNLFYSCVLFAFIGAGSTSMLSASMKCGLMSFPNMKGLATGLPVTFFGASGLFFSIIASFFFPGDTSKLLYSLFYIPLIVSIICIPTIFMIDLEYRNSYSKLNATPSYELSNLTPVASNATNSNQNFSSNNCNDLILKKIDFWLLSVSLAILAGLSQMYIYSLGLIVSSLFGGSNFIKNHLTDYFKIFQIQQHRQVSLLSLGSCLGRLSNGILGDLMTNQMKRSRIYVLSIPFVLILTGQIIGLVNSKISIISIMTLFIGFGYGSLYSGFTQITSELWGIENFSFNWGMMNLSVVISNIIFSSYFAKIYDSHSFQFTVDGGKQIQICDLKNKCYNSVFKVAIAVASVSALLIISAIVRVVSNNRFKRAH